MEPARKQPALRLVRPAGSAVIGRATSSSVAAIPAHHQDPMTAVGQENWAAAQLDPRDPRWTLALRTVAELNGPVLPAEGRQRVLRNARSLGIRQFDANLIMAVVQDRARRGESIDEAWPTLRCIAPKTTRRRPLLGWLTLVGMVLAVEALGIWLLLGL